MNESKLSLKKRNIRNFFLSFEKQFKSEEEIEDELVSTGMTYIQMRLPIENITKEFEEEIEKKVESNILRAKFREAKKEDLDSLVYLYNRSWMTSNTPFSAISRETIKKINEYADTVILIARVYGSDAGFVILDLEGPNHEFGVIAGLGVLPRYQRKGLGTVIGKAAWEYFKNKGIKELRCEVYKDKKVSYNFIKSLGFEEYDVKVYKSEDFELD
jgi:ribosomal protein S18 acetylase RimI-like enzyme